MVGPIYNSMYNTSTFHGSIYNTPFILILGAIPGINNGGGGKGGGIMKGENIPVGVAAAAGGGFAP